jgi:uncharacterized protein (DUF1778 family)
MKTPETFTKKVSVRLTEKQYKLVSKNAKTSKMNLAEYFRSIAL